MDSAIWGTLTTLSAKKKKEPMFSHDVITLEVEVMYVLTISSDLLWEEVIVENTSLPVNIS